MTVSTTIIEESGKWTLKKIDDHEGDYWYSLEMDYGRGERQRVSIPFDEVHASGGLIHLDRDNSRSGTINGALTGVNKYKEDSWFPEEIVERLMDIGRW